MIQATVHTDDHAREVEFDAAPWFEQATDDDIRALADCAWGGDYPADAVAQFFEGKDEDIGDLFAYLGHANEARTAMLADRIGFECHVDQDEALAWLKGRR